MFVYIYSNLAGSEVEQPKQSTAQNENSNNSNEEKSPSTEKENKTPGPDKTPKIEEPIKETQLNPEKVTVSNTSTTLPASSVFSTLDNSYGIYQLDELSKLIDRASTLSASDRKLLLSKTSSIYATLPSLINQLTSSDQRKLCNYSGEFSNFLKRNGFTVSPSIEKTLNPYCN